MGATILPHLAERNLLWRGRAVRRSGRPRCGADRGPRGDVGAPRTARRAVHGRQLGRADHHAARHPDQQRTHLPPIAAGEVIWFSFSEPEAGSDLASLRTTARPMATDGWSVGRRSGPYATMAQWCFLLARTSKVGVGATQKKQQGLTIFLVPMDDPAITVRPIRCMMGPHHLNEVFFDDLRGDPGPCAGHRRPGLVDRADDVASEQVGIAPARALRAAVGICANGSRRPMGRVARGAAGPVGTGC